MLKVKVTKSEPETVYFKTLDDFNEYVRKNWFDIERMEIELIQFWRNSGE